MPLNARFHLFSLLAACTLAFASEAKAATVTFDFNSPVPAPFQLHPDSPGIINGRCAGSLSDAPCLGVNSTGAAKLSIQSGIFSVASFWFQLLGENDNLLVSTDHGTFTLLETVYGRNNGGQSLDVSAQGLFQNITFLSFLTNAGTARVDDLKVTHLAPVPLPASAALLLGGLAGLAALRRRPRRA